MNADGTAISLDDLTFMSLGVATEDEVALPDATITISPIFGPGTVRLLAIRPNAEAPFGDDWVEVPWGSNLRDDYFLTAGAYYEFDFYLEGLAFGEVTLKLSATVNGGTCEDHVKLTVIRAKMDPVTSGINPVPINPAIVAPVDVGLDDGTTFNEGNKFELTTLEPDIDLSGLPVSWVFELNDGTIDLNMTVQVDTDKRGARLDFPLPSFGNFGTGRMLFVLGVPVPGSIPVGCASVDTLARNIQPDIEQREFRLFVKAHLTTDGMGNGTTRTVSEVSALMSDVTNLMSQCGIIVTMGSITETTVSTSLTVDLGTVLEWRLLFGTDEDETAIDIYFVEQIEGGNTRGFTVTPFQTLTSLGDPEAGIAIADSEIDGAIIGQEAVRVIAHELTHYLLNHFLPANDHVGDSKNLMFPSGSQTKRDLLTTQCVELRDNYGVD